jgi:hypothetical protein
MVVLIYWWDFILADGKMESIEYKQNFIDCMHKLHSFEAPFALFRSLPAGVSTN